MPARLVSRILAGAVALAVVGGGATLEAGESRHWSFQPVRRPPVPSVRGAAWVRSPVDSFVLARLEEKGLRPGPPADRRTLLRRVYLDLIGLPPTPEEQRAFLEDPSPDAFARVVEDLLARPQYGERWARHWLDVARYADTNGYERDGAKPSAWRYRDYLIDALNRDKPYDRLVTEQVAGDEVEGSNAETQIATTFLRLGSWDDEPAEPKVDRCDQLDDVLGTTATALLGVTLRCARCHDHKFEPFSQVDYYRMLAVFDPLKRPQLGRTDLDRPVGNAAELAAYREATAKVDAVQEQIFVLDLMLRNRILARRKSTLPADSLDAFVTEPGRRTSAQKQLLKKFNDQLEQEFREAATTEEWELRTRLTTKLAAVQARELPRAYVLYEEGTKPPATHVLHRGDPSRPKQEVGPGLPEVLVTKQPEPPTALAHSTGRRLWLARWLASPENPLTARVMVNRVWQHHFGRGIVATTNDFGVMGEAPTHPELLDWLAAEFMERGWSLKNLHRLIVLSSTYQQAATFQTEAARVDPKGTLLWRWRQQRLEAEAVRDAVLAVSGQLNPQQHGPGVYPTLPRAVLESQSRPGDGWGKSDDAQAARRSIYIFVKRSLPVPELEVLDSPDTTSSCEARPVSTTAPQALTFLNGDFINQQARHFAARLRREAGDDPQAQTQRAFELALCRPPRPEELRASVAFLNAQRQQIEADARKEEKEADDAAQRALEAFCLVVLNTNEFVYLD